MKTRILSLLAVAALAAAACGGPPATPAPSDSPASPTFSAAPSEALTPAPTPAATLWNPFASLCRGPDPSAEAHSYAAAGPSAMEALNCLDSYQFSWALAPDANPNAGNSAAGHGIVANNPTKAWYTDGALFTVSIADVGVWSSPDGTTWTGPVLAVSGVPRVSIGPYGWQFGGIFPRAAWGGRPEAGTQTKNGIDCLHYKIDSQTDLWVAVDGGYAVSGLRDDGNANYSFDITHVNDPSNKVSPPSSDVAAPPTYKGD